MATQIGCWCCKLRIYHNPDFGSYGATPHSEIVAGTAYTFGAVNRLRGSRDSVAP
jgi:hypothetical protein